MPEKENPPKTDSTIPIEEKEKEKEYNPLDWHRERARELGGPVWTGD